MLFSSIEFLYYFLPLVILGYFLLPKQLRNGWLLIVSLVFYAWGEPKLIWVMLGSIVLNWLWGIGIGRAQKTGWKRFFLVLSCLTCLGLLGWFKYADFAFENINALLGTKIPLPKLILPGKSTGLPRQCAHWLAMTCSFSHTILKGTNHALFQH